jgi:hypothetical protein
LKANKLNLKKAKSRRDPLWNKVPSYGVEALISSIEDPQELMLALQSISGAQRSGKSSSESDSRDFKKRTSLKSIIVMA